jgi:hypothetical protein
MTDLTEQQLKDRLAALRARIAAVEENSKYQQYSRGGSQVVLTGASLLAELYAKEDKLVAALRRVQRGGGIRVRYGVPT